MLSIRSLSRSTLRTASRLSSQPVARRMLSSGTKSIYRPSTFQQTSKVTSLLSQRATFSTSLKTLQTQEGQVDGELSAKLQEEYNMEEEMSPSEAELPASLQDFLDSTGFQLSEEAGSEEVVLTKTFGQETIRVSFSTADMDAYDPEADLYRDAEDSALADEGAADATGNAGAGRNKANTEDEAAEEEELDDEPSFPARIEVSIEKPGTDAVLQFSSTATDGQILIENVFYLPKKQLADPKDVQADWNRRSLYTGPPYGNLDEDLQVLMEKYLDERGINTALALWVPEYIDFKEQREYLRWLQNLKNFVDA